MFLPIVCGLCCRLRDKAWWLVGLAVLRPKYKLVATGPGLTKPQRVSAPVGGTA